uniref:7TM GPCR serpentine receptor class x (Srx) domain-containing protein n=1 Tax=Acrobeloides nanus TaxID=290746 RepID=A0A914CKY7_9BILA
MSKFNAHFNSSDSDKVTVVDYIAQSFDWNFMTNMTSINLFNEARRSRLELLMENAMRTKNFTNLGESCSSLNYGRFKEVRPDIDRKWQNGVRTFDTLRAVNLGLDMFFGILGLFVSLVVIGLIYKYQDLKTSYGYFCLIQAYTDLILLGNIVIFESFISVREMYIGVTDTLGDAEWTSDNPTLPWRWDYLMFYIYYSSKFTTSILTFCKAFTRFLAVYFPMFFYYHDIFDQHHTIMICLVCKVIFARSQYIQLDTCSQMYWWIQVYAEFILAMLCFLFDMATFYKLVRINKTRVNPNDHVEANKRLLERLFLIQNCGDLATFFIMFIPNIIYAAGCQFVSLLCQWRILKQLPKSTTVTQQVLAQTTN